jgi:hypothetical protein
LRRLGGLTAKEGEQIAVEVEGCELAGSEVGREHARAHGRVKDPGVLELLEQRIDVRDLDPAARGSGEERLRPRVDRLDDQILPIAPMPRPSFPRDGAMRRRRSAASDSGLLVERFDAALEWARMGAIGLEEGFPMRTQSPLSGSYPIGDRNASFPRRRGSTENRIAKP